jgi:bifunctional non-homologous end joining protein LigD
MLPALKEALFLLPDDKNTFEEVIQIAQVVKKLLDSIDVDSCVKTSGSSGIHIYIPLGAQYSYDQSKQLAELIVTLVHQELPDLTSIVRNPAKRKGKIYLDFLQNREIQTAAAAYSLRPKRGMPVSTPLHWVFGRLGSGLRMYKYSASCFKTPIKKLYPKDTAIKKLHIISAMKM